MGTKKMKKLPLAKKKLLFSNPKTHVRVMRTRNKNNSQNHLFCEEITLWVMENRKMYPHHKTASSAEKLKKTVNFATFKTLQRMNLTIGSLSRRRVVVSVQVWVYWVKIVCRVRMLDRYDRFGSDFGLTMQSPTLPSWLITRVASGWHISVFVFGIYANFESIGFLVYVSEFSAPSYGSVSDFWGESPVKLIGPRSALLLFKPKIRARPVVRHPYFA